MSGYSAEFKFLVWSHQQSKKDKFILFLIIDTQENQQIFLFEMQEPVISFLLLPF